MKTNRRDFLTLAGGGLSFVALTSQASPLFAQVAASAAASDHALVVVELAGGNDGLNSVIPWQNDLYYKNRPTLGVPKHQAVRLTNELALHPALAPLGELFKQGDLAIVQGVGYPNPDRSHFRSMEIWQTASTAAVPPDVGWVGNFLDQVSPASLGNEALPGFALTGSLPQACHAKKFTMPLAGELDIFATSADPAAKLRKKLSTAGASAAMAGKGSGKGASVPTAFVRQQNEAVYRAAERLQAAAAKYQSSVEYPQTGLGQQLRRAAQILTGRLGTRVLYASQDGYDTHSNQAESHAQLLGDLATSLAALTQDLKQQGLADKVAVLVFSEFGRRVDENASAGTDHGAASVSFVLGGTVKAGLYGSYPSLEKLGEGDLIHTTDFRSLYSSLLTQWLGSPAKPILGSEEFSTLDLFGAA